METPIENALAEIQRLIKKHGITRARAWQFWEARQRLNETPDKLLFRDATIDASALKADSREVELSFASEQAVERYDWDTGEIYLEVLDHGSTKSADFSRLNNGGALLRDHNRSVQPGVIKRGSASICPDKKSRCTVKFSRSKIGEEELQDVRDEIRTLVSVGYQVGREISREKTNGVDVRRFEWMPYEVSTVSIPADTTVGIGREKNPVPPIDSVPEVAAKQPDQKNLNDNETMKRNLQLDAATGEVGGTAKAGAAIAAPAVVRSADEIQKEERSRMREILAIGRKFKRDDDAQTALGDGTSVEAFRKLVLEKMESGAETQTVQTVNHRSPGEFLINSPEYKRLCEAGVKGKRLNLDMEIPVGFSRTTGDPATTTGLTSIDKQPGIVLLGVMPPRVADLMSQTPTQNTTIRYISENSLTNAAAAVAENGQYPEATWDLVETDAGIKKISVIGRVTDEFFMDYDATRDYINNRLAYMVAIKEDSELLNADATGNRIKGLLNFTGIQTQPQGGDTVLDMLFKAITKVRAVGFFEPDAIVMNPTDMQNIRLVKDKNGQYMFGGPFTGSYGQPGTAAGFTLMIWGLPVIWTTSIASGTILVGAFRLGAQIFRKLGLTIETTNSDASDFQYGRIAIRANTRLTLACYRPLGFCTCTGAGAGGAFQ